MTHQAELIEAQERNEVSIRRSSITRSPIDKNNKVDIAKLLNPEKELSERDIQIDVEPEDIVEGTDERG